MNPDHIAEHMGRSVLGGMATVLVGSIAFLFAEATVASAADYIEILHKPDGANQIKIGYLTCDVKGGISYLIGSTRQADCVFQSRNGTDALDFYTAEIRKFGMDIGFNSRARFRWIVAMPMGHYSRGLLSGQYAGANILIGGPSGTIHLQPFSLKSQRGLSLSAIVTSLTLRKD